MYCEVSRYFDVDVKLMLAGTCEWLQGPGPPIFVLVKSVV